jgi:hypothetical protein
LVRRTPAIAAAVCFLATIQRPPGFAVTINYVALAALLWFAAGFAIGRIDLKSKGQNDPLKSTAEKKLASRSLRAIAVVAACVAYGRYLDEYNSHWNEAHASGEATVSSSYVDTYRRGEEKPAYRWLRQDMSWPDGRSTSFISEGPMAGEGKPHGKWEQHNRKVRGPEEVTFFWYGDEISEGEWHLRKHD